MAGVDIKQLEGKPWYYGAGIGAVIGGALFLLASFYVPPNFQEMEGTIAAKKTELAGLEEKVAQGRAAERRLPQLREEVKRIDMELQRLLQILPANRNTEEIIKKVETLTRQSDFNLKVFEPKPDVKKDFYAEWPIEIQVDATYHNLALFFDKMARFSRIINIEDLVMVGRQDAAGRTLGATFVAKTFVYLPDADKKTVTSPTAPKVGEAGPAIPPKKPVGVE